MNKYSANVAQWLNYDHFNQSEIDAIVAFIEFATKETRATKRGRIRTERVNTATFGYCTCWKVRHQLPRERLEPHLPMKQRVGPRPAKGERKS